VDGLLARRLGVASERGARLDSQGDLAMFLMLPVGVWWLWPELILREAVWIGLVVVSYLLPIAFGFLKFGRLTSYHTWGAKVSAITMGLALLMLIGLDQPSLFHIAAILFLVSQLEELAITATLSRPETDVPTLVHAMCIEGARKAAPDF
jgi:CDP-diacylglycerol--glycerol-3-phosphate 3-phosphatidyltransferase